MLFRSEYCEKENKKISEAMFERETTFLEQDPEKTRAKMKKAWSIMQASAKKPLKENIVSMGGMIGGESRKLHTLRENKKNLCGDVVSKAITYAAQPSLLSGGLKDIDSVFAELGKRFSFGGQAGSDQRIYYINTRELTGNKYGTPNPVPFRVVDQRAGIDIDIGIRCFGEYSYRVVNPILDRKSVV